MAEDKIGFKMDITDGIAVFRAGSLILTDVQSALDLIADAAYHAGSNMILFEENISKDFFKLSTGLLGDILQKFVTYGVRLAIVGDFSKYSSPALRDFIRESNKGSHIYFVPDELSALEKLKS